MQTYHRINHAEGQKRGLKQEPLLSRPKSATTIARPAFSSEFLRFLDPDNIIDLDSTNFNKAILFSSLVLKNAQRTTFWQVTQQNLIQIA